MDFQRRLRSKPFMWGDKDSSMLLLDLPGAGPVLPCVMRQNKIMVSSNKYPSVLGSK